MSARGHAILACLLLAAGQAAASPTAYVAHGGGNIGAPQGGLIGRIDLDTGNYQVLTAKLGSLTGLILKDGSLFAYDVQGGVFRQVDPGSGALLATIPRVGGAHLTDLAMDPTDGRVYGVDVNYAFHRIDLASGQLSFLGQMDSPGGLLALAFDDAGRLYAHATNAGGVFHQVDKASGAILAAIAGGAPGGALGLEFEPGSGRLIASECCDGSDGAFGERLYSIDPASGAASLLLDFDDGRRIHDLAFAPAGAADLKLEFQPVRTPLRGGAGTLLRARVANAGPDAATGVVLLLGSNLPSSSLKVVMPEGWQCLEDPGTTSAMECRYEGSLATGLRLIAIKVTLPASTPGQVLQVYGEIHSSSADPDRSNNVDSVEIPVPATAAGSAAAQADLED